MQTFDVVLHIPFTMEGWRKSACLLLKLLSYKVNCCCTGFYNTILVVIECFSYFRFLDALQSRLLPAVSVNKLTDWLLALAQRGTTVRLAASAAGHKHVRTTSGDEAEHSQCH